MFGASRPDNCCLVKQCMLWPLMGERFRGPCGVWGDFLMKRLKLILYHTPTNSAGQKLFFSSVENKVRQLTKKRVVCKG